MCNKLNPLAWKFFCFLSLALAALSLTWSFFQFPTFDDWHYAAHGLLNPSIWQAVKTEYLTWNGRYVSAFLLSASPLTWAHPEFIRFFGIVSFTLLLMSTLFFLHTLFRQKLYDRNLSFVSLLFAIAFTFFQEYSHTAFFWFAGNINYYLAWPFHLIHLALLIKIHRSENVVRNYFLVIFVSIISIGINEAAMLLTSLINTANLLLAWKTQITFRKSYKLPLLIFLITGFFALLVVLAPGNASRAQETAGWGRIIHALVKSTTYPITLWLRLIVQFPVLFLLPALTYSLWISRVSLLLPSLSNFGIKLRIVLFWFTMTLLCAPSFWAHYGIPNHRSHYYFALPVFLFTYTFFPISFWKKLSQHTALLVGFSLIGIGLKTPFKEQIPNYKHYIHEAQLNSQRWGYLEDFLHSKKNISELDTSLFPTAKDEPFETLSRYLRAYQKTKLQK